MIIPASPHQQSSRKKSSINFDIKKTLSVPHLERFVSGFLDARKLYLIFCTENPGFSCAQKRTVVHNCL